MHLDRMAYGSAEMGARHGGADVQPPMPTGPLVWSYNEQRGSFARAPNQPPLYTPAAQDLQQQQGHGQGQHDIYGCASGLAGLHTMDLEHATYICRAPGHPTSPDQPFVQDPAFHQGCQHQGSALHQHLKHAASGHVGGQPPQELHMQGQLGSGMRVPARLRPMHAGQMDVQDTNPAYEGGWHTPYQAQAVNSALPSRQMKTGFLWALHVRRGLFYPICAVSASSMFLASRFG